MKTLTRNVALLGVCVVAGIALLTVRSQFAVVTPGKTYAVSTGNLNPSTDVQVGNTFTLEFLIDGAGEWNFVSHSNNISYIGKTIKEKGSKKVGNKKLVFEFNATESGPAWATFSRMNSGMLEKPTFNFTVK